MSKRARMASGAFGKFLYRRLNASLKLITPSAYADRRKLTRKIHRHYLELFPDPESREKVLFALARALLGSSRFYSDLWSARESLRNVPMGIIWGMKDSAFQPYNLDKWASAFPHAQVFRIENAGHWPHEEQPEAVIAALERFGL